MIAVWTAIKIKAAQWYFVATTLAIAVLVYVVDRRNRELAQIHLEEQASALAEQLAAIKAQSQRSDLEYEKAADNYARLRAVHGELLTKLGIAPVTGGVPAPRKPNTSGSGGPN